MTVMFEAWDAVVLARAQFAFTMSFHIVFPAFSIGLASYLAVLTAFFLEAGFLGVMLFGLERVGHRLHFLATLMVATGTLISAFWILSANSWMQTPAGYAVNADGQFVAADWLKVIFNPSFPYRLVHMVLAAYLTTALVVGAVGAFHLLRDQ